MTDASEPASEYYEIVVEVEETGQPPDSVFGRLFRWFQGRDYEPSGMRIFEVIERSTQRRVLRHIEPVEPDHADLYEMVEQDLTTMDRAQFAERWDRNSDNELPGEDL